MRKNSFIFNFSLFAVAALAIMGADYFLAHSPAAANFFNAYSDVAFDNPLRFYEKLAHAEHMPGKPLVMVLGSSVARESIDEEIVAHELGGQAQVLNMGFFHARPVDLWMLSDELLALHPDLVVLPVLPGETYIEYSYRLTMPYYFRGKMFDLVGSHEVFQHWREFFYAYLSEKSFLFRYRDSIGSAVLRYGQDRLGLSAWHQRGNFRFVDEREVLPALDEKLSFFGQDFVPDTGLNIRAMTKLLEELAKRKVPVLLVPMANHPKLEPELDRLQKVEYLGWRKSGFPLALEKWSRISGVTLLHVPEGLVPAQDYADYIHLNARGRAAFSHWFAGWLKRSRILPFSASP